MLFVSHNVKKMMIFLCYTVSYPSFITLYVCKKYYEESKYHGSSIVININNNNTHKKLHRWIVGVWSGYMLLRAEHLEQLLSFKLLPNCCNTFLIFTLNSQRQKKYERHAQL